MKLYLLFVYTFILTPFYSWSQTKKELFIISDNNDINLNSITDSISLKKELYKYGYFFYQTNSVHYKDSITHLIKPGIKTNTIAINQPNKKRLFLPPEKLEKWTQLQLKKLDNSGKSFSQLIFNKHKTSNDTLYINTSIQESKQREIDKIISKGYTKFPERFIKQYFGLHKTFSKNTIIETEEKINQLKFVKKIKSPGVLFTKDSTHIYLYLEKIKANKLEALVGFTNKENSKNIQFNGYIDIELLNVLHKGEQLSFKWSNSGNNQQETNLSLESPYIFNSPVSSKYHLNIFKQDTTFVNTAQKIQLSLTPNYKHKISTYFFHETSTTFNNTVLNTNYNKTIAGVNYIYQKTNNWKLPKAKIELDFGYGNKRGINTEKQQIFKSDILYNIELSKQHHLFIRNRNAFLNTDNKLNNELFRTGGATTMRGFLDQSIISYLHNYSNIEYRIFTNPISYLYSFSDFGQFINTENSNKIIALGLGYTLGNKNGLLKLSYAVGKTEKNNFNINNGFFHINFTTLF